MKMIAVLAMSFLGVSGKMSAALGVMVWVMDYQPI